jgi:ribosomal protein S8
MMGYKDNVSIEDIKRIEGELNITLTNEQRESVLKEYERIVWDSYKDWDELIELLIVKQSLIQILKDKNK